MNKFMTKILAVALALSTVTPAFAVTDKEMEEARAITAQAYLRYANDGSGYLDDIHVKSMAELEKKLKAKEKENLKAFNSVKTPSDYSGWSKKELVEFWSVTFFTSPNLAEKGKAAKKRVRSRIEKMTVSAAAPAPAAKQETAQKTTPAVENAADTKSQKTENPEAVEQSPARPDADRAIAEQEAIVSETVTAESQDEVVAEDVTPVRKNSGTVWYIVILCVLVAAVFALVIFAARIMKKSERMSPEEDTPEPAAKPGHSALPAMDERGGELASALERKNKELNLLRKELEQSNDANDKLSADYSRLKGEFLALREQYARLETENTAMADKLREFEAGRAVSRQSAPAAEEKPQQKPAEEILHVIYLGRVNSKGIFVRADRRVSLGNTIYRLDTDDGVVGTFRVAHNEAVEEMALMEPLELLSGGCVAKDLGATDGVTRIITETPGTAIFENGYWRVLRPSKIRYE